MKLKFDPEELFREKIGRPISDEEREELNDFIIKYILLKNQQNSNPNLKEIIESALETDGKNQFSASEFKDMVLRYQESRDPNGLLSVPGDLPHGTVEKVMAAFGAYHEHKYLDKIEKVMNQNGFCNINTPKSYLKKRSNIYELVTFDGFDEKNKTDIRTSFVAVSPSEWENLESRIRKHEEIGISLNEFGEEIRVGDIIKTTFWLDFLSTIGYTLIASALSSSTWAGNWNSYGITMGVSTALIPALSIAYSTGLKIAKRANLRKIENYFSDSSPYTHVSSPDPYNPQVLLHALSFDKQQNK